VATWSALLRLHRQHFLFFLGNELVDFGDKFISQFLYIVLRATLVIFGDRFVFE